MDMTSLSFTFVFSKWDLTAPTSSSFEQSFATLRLYTLLYLLSEAKLSFAKLAKALPAGCKAPAKPEATASVLREVLYAEFFLNFFFAIAGRADNGFAPWE